MSGDEKLTLGEAATRYLAGLSPESRATAQVEVNKFVRWYGQTHKVAGLTPPEVAKYAEQMSLSDREQAKKLKTVQAFLAYAKQEGWTKSNLGVHLKIRKGRVAAPGAASAQPETSSLTEEGYTALKAELEKLTGKRAASIEEIRRAAADKDFRENAPLHAAREQRSHLEGQIKELEETLKSATVVGEKDKQANRVNLGDRVTLCDLTSGENLNYTVVGQREVNLAKGKISNVSPIGKAVIGRSQGETVEVTTPAGKLRYRIDSIER